MKQQESVYQGGKLSLVCNSIAKRWDAELRRKQLDTPAGQKAARERAAQRAMRRSQRRTWSRRSA